MAGPSFSHCRSVHIFRYSSSTSMTHPSLAGEQTLALAMARHPRLGEMSHAAVLTADALQIIHHFVAISHAELVGSKRVVCVCVRTGDVRQPEIKREHALRRLNPSPFTN